MNHLINLKQIVGRFPIVGHDYFPDKFALKNIPSFFPILLLVNFVDMIDDIEDTLISDYLFGGINPQVVSILKQDKVGSVATKHHEVVNVYLLLRVEVFSRSSDFHVVKPAHHISEAVVQKTQ